MTAESDERRRERNIRFQADPNDPRHGTPNGYGNLQCRCDLCRAAWAASQRQQAATSHAKYLAAQRAARFQADPNDPRHGTLNGYRNLWCRCGLCQHARAEERRVHKR